MADSNESRRKTLDEIRSELAAEYPVASETEQPVSALDEDPIAIERGRSVERHRQRRRRYAMAAAFVGITASMLLVAAHALTREPVQPNALASAPGVTAPSAAPANAVREPQPSAPIVAPAALAELDRQVKALSRDVKALTERLQRSDSRIGGIESQVQGVESSMRRLVDDAAAAATRAAERTATAQRPTPPARAVAAAPGERPPGSALERAIPAKLVVPETTPAAKESTAAEEMQVTADVSPPAAPTRDVGKAARSETPSTLRGKLSAEWRTIKQGFAGAGDDFKAAMRELGRTITKE
jgi:hypothetical protein